MALDSRVQALEAKIDSLLAINGNERDRLTRIEQSLGQLTDAVVSLARAEEKLSNLSEEIGTIKRNIDKLDDRIIASEKSYNDIQNRVTKVEGVTINLTKFFWWGMSLIATVAGGVVLAYTNANV